MLKLSGETTSEVHRNYSLKSSPEDAHGGLLDRRRVLRLRGLLRHSLDELRGVVGRLAAMAGDGEADFVEPRCLGT